MQHIQAVQYVQAACNVFRLYAAIMSIYNVHGAVSNIADLAKPRMYTNVFAWQVIVLDFLPIQSC